MALFIIRVMYLIALSTSYLVCSCLWTCPKGRFSSSRIILGFFSVIWMFTENETRKLCELNSFNLCIFIMSMFVANAVFFTGPDYLITYILVEHIGFQRCLKLYRFIAYFSRWILQLYFVLSVSVRRRQEYISEVSWTQWKLNFTYGFDLLCIRGNFSKIYTII